MAITLKILARYSRTGRTTSIEIPIQLDHTFVPPDLETAIRFYPDYVNAGGIWPFNGYLSWVLKQIDKAKPNGYTGQSAFDSFVHWIGGLPIYCQFIRQYLG